MRKGIPRVNCQQGRGQSRSSQNICNMGMETTHQRQRNPRIHGILQLLSTIHRRIQQNSQTTIRQDKERKHLGIGRKRTRSIRRITKKIVFSPCVDTFQTRKAPSDRNRPMEVRLFRNPFSTRRRWQMETHCLSIEDNGTSGMQL